MHNFNFRVPEQRNLGKRLYIFMSDCETKLKMLVSSSAWLNLLSSTGLKFPEVEPKNWLIYFCVSVCLCPLPPS